MRQVNCPNTDSGGWSHLWCLQVHERTLQGDFLMALLRDLVTSRRKAGNPLKVTPPSPSPPPPPPFLPGVVCHPLGKHAVYCWCCTTAIEGSALERLA